MLKINPLESISTLNIKIQHAIQAIPISDHYFIALSGGMDSVALAYFCLPYLKKHTNNIHVIHVNHGLSPNANDWADFCVQMCDHLGLVCHIENVSVVSEGKGLEAAARKARYKIFSRYLKGGGVLLQGHHLNDQAETVLMRVFKGLGPEAIKGIPQMRPLAHGLVYRPWLEIPRELIKSAVDSFGLTWVEDESNSDLRFERNYLRHDVLPLLSQRRSTILNDLARTAKKSQESVEFIQAWCEESKSRFLSSRYAQYRAVDLNELFNFSGLQQKFILRFWFDSLGVVHPNENSFQRIFDELLTAKSDSKAEICWNDYILRVFDKSLFCLNRSQASAFQVDDFMPISILLADLKESLSVMLPVGRLSITLMESSELAFDDMNREYAPSGNGYELVCQLPESVNGLAINFRKGGEKIGLTQTHSSSLKKLYQTKKVLPWMRDKLPLIYANDELVCSMAGFVSNKYKLAQNNNNSQKITVKCLRFRFELI